MRRMRILLVLLMVGCPAEAPPPVSGVPGGDSGPVFGADAEAPLDTGAPLTNDAPALGDDVEGPCDCESGCWGGQCVVIIEDTQLGGTVSHPGAKVRLRGTVSVEPISQGGSGSLRIEAGAIVVEGTLRANAAGHDGGGGGGGGGGGSRQAPHGLAGAAGEGSVGAQAGGANDGCGSTKYGGVGGLGDTGSGPWAGALGAGGGCNTPDFHGPGNAGLAGVDGGYAGVGLNGDVSTDAQVQRGSGGGGGGGGSGGGNGNGEGGGGGGGGGAGGRGGGTIQLVAQVELQVSGSIEARGGLGAAGASGQTGKKTGDKTGSGGDGGAGGSAFTAGDGSGGAGGLFEGGGTPGGAGGQGGAGSGGGVLLLCEAPGGLQINGNIDVSGGRGTTNGGTVKVLYVGTAPGGQITAGRVLITPLDPNAGSPPQVLITSPANGSTTDQSTITVTGTASDDSTVTAVQARVAGGAWSACAGTANFDCAGLALADGPNLIEVQATDDDQLHGSASVAVTVSSTPPESVDIFDPQRTAAVAQGSVGVQGNRFVVGGAVYYPKTDFLTAVPPGDDILTYNTHCYLSQDSARQKTLREALVASEYNAIYVYTLNQGDYGANGSHPENVVTPYGSGGWSFDTSQLNAARVAAWQSTLSDLIDTHHLKPFIWLAADDSPAIANASLAQWTAYVDDMVAAFDGYPVVWVLGLEVDEYWSAAEVAERRAVLQSKTAHPVGVHLTTSETKKQGSAYVVGFDFVMAQFSSPQSNAQYQANTQAYIALDRPVLASEFNVKGKGSGGESEGSVTARSKAIGAVIAGVGQPPRVAGLGNGIALGEPEPPPTQPELPANFEGVVWLHKNVSQWAETGALSVTVSDSQVCLNYDKANVWPGKDHLGLLLNANPWIFIYQNDTWYAATWEWMKFGQTCKNKSAVAGDHIKKDPLWDFAPVSGQAYWFMVSGLARDSATNVSERTQPVKVIWP